MKKKGLIIATIVMVLVLAVSLTTATYAWFTVSDVTTIQGMNVEVVPNNAVAIGVKADNTYASTPTPDMFWTGDVTYAHTTPGALEGGWSGTTKGFGPAIEHNIKWGAQKMAVAATTGKFGATFNAAEGATDNASKANTTSWAGTGTLIAANAKEATDATSIDAKNAKAAVANINGEDGGDFVHLFLGISPTKALASNKLVITMDADQAAGTQIGILAAVHVAYRLNNGEWQDAQFFAGKSYLDKHAEYTNEMGGVDTAIRNAYGKSYAVDGTDAVLDTNGVSAIVIPLAALAKDSIDQLEIVIYIDGTDGDCNNSALGAKGEIRMFFLTTEA